MRCLTSGCHSGIWRGARWIPVIKGSLKRHGANGTYVWEKVILKCDFSRVVIMQMASDVDASPMSVPMSPKDVSVDNIGRKHWPIQSRIWVQFHGLIPRILRLHMTTLGL